ncbi:MAG: hypothetical protein HMLKMBBP_03069 [Planctomycetes bacterium]|nr:hypothetical protein [Planctomycetota bacterium]
MHTAPLYDPAVLAALIEHSRASRDPCPSSLGRVVTLELAHRVVLSARQVPAQAGFRASN